MLASDRKFEEQDLPLILAALHKARQLKMNAKVVVEFKYDGGCVDVSTTYTEKIK